MDYELEITKHATARIKQRIGIKSKAAKRQFELALTRGTDLAGMDVRLAQWAITAADTVRTDDRRSVVLFNNHLFLYVDKGYRKVLLTVLNLPSEVM